MKISKVIELLEDIREDKGDLIVLTQDNYGLLTQCTHVLWCQDDKILGEYVFIGEK